MVPMRSVPHRVVCLLGLDDGVVPAAGVGRRRRRAGPRPADRRARRPQRGPPAAPRRDPGGDRDAGDHLHRRQRAHRPAAATRRTARASCSTRSTDDAPATPVRRRRHRPPPAAALRPPERHTRRARRTRRAVHLRPDRAGRRQRRRRHAHRAPRRSSTTAAAATGRTMSRWPTWCAFWGDPVKGFFGRAWTSRCPGTRTARGRHAGRDRQPGAVGGRRPGAARPAARHAPRGCRTREWRRGELPPGRLGWRMPATIRDSARQLAEAACEPPAGRAGRVDVDVDLGGGRRLRGTVSPVYGDRTVSVTYSRLGAKHLLQSWIPLLALAAQQPETELDRALHRPRHSRSRDRHAALASPPTSRSHVLRDLVALCDAGRGSRCRCRSRRRARGAERRRDVPIQSKRR